MQEVAKINLDNEMDLILAHKRTMKLAELCGLTLTAQTVFATAVSEIARCAIGYGNKSYLVLGIHHLKLNRKEIVASVFNTINLSNKNSEAFSYAARLMGDLHLSNENGLYEVRINQRIHFGGLISDAKIESFKNYFKQEPPLSPYDEIRKKNIQLIDLSERLQKSETQYRLLTDTLPLMMFALNPLGEVTYANKWLKDYLGETFNQVSNSSWQSILHPEDLKDIWQNWERALVNTTVFRAQARLKQKEKDRFLWHLISIIPINNEKDGISNWIGFFVDINAQKSIEETLKDNKELKQTQIELERYQSRLEQKINELNISNHDLEQFAYIASHDLQEPLRKIKTFSSLLEKDLTLNPDQKTYFDKIISSSDRMSNLIKDVLNYSRLSNHMEQFIPVDLNAIVDTIKSDFDLLLQEKKATLTSVSLPVVAGIPSQLLQLFSNLISNSLKFAEKKPVISITSKRLSGDEVKAIPQLNSSANYERITLTDNGIGFEQQYAEKIFTIFQRLNNRQSYSGTGIGLALCKKIVSNHKGLITAEGLLNQGATFNIYFPVI
ncbi:sensor histidine kinase [Runella sp.]|uniref:sensor histidine kinase n=1 Tax=Runella sp. TaxID=1960881 RepID=UPI003D10E83B